MTYTTYLVLNYRTGKIRLLQKHPARVGAWEVLGKLRLNVEAPTNPLLTLETTITIPPISLFEMVLEEE